MAYYAITNQIDGFAINLYLHTFTSFNSLTNSQFSLAIAGIAIRNFNSGTRAFKRIFTFFIKNGKYKLVFVLET